MSGKRMGAARGSADESRGGMIASTVAGRGGDRDTRLPPAAATPLPESPGHYPFEWRTRRLGLIRFDGQIGCVVHAA
jgi:hypothetical protein